MVFHPARFAGRHLFGLQRRRRRAGDIQRPRHPFAQSAPRHRRNHYRRLHHQRAHGLHLYSRRNPGDLSALGGRAGRGAGGGLFGRGFAWRRVFVRVAQSLGRGRVYLRRGDRAVGIDRRQKGAAALQAAFSRQLRLVWTADDGEQCRNFRLRAVHRARGRRAFFGYRQAQQRRLESVFPFRPLRAPGQLRSPARHAVSRFAANGGRSEGWTRAQGRDSGAGRRCRFCRRRR